MKFKCGYPEPKTKESYVVLIGPRVSVTAAKKADFGARNDLTELPN